MGLEFDDKFGLVFQEDYEEVNLEEMKYSFTVSSGKQYDTVNVSYDPNRSMIFVDDYTPSWRTFDEQIFYYKQLIKCLMRLRKEVKE